jgi:hypothetical protein
LHESERRGTGDGGMKDTQPSQDRHEQAAYEAALDRRLARVREHEAEIRRLDDERWQRRMAAAMPVDAVLSSGDFWGAVL